MATRPPFIWVLGGPGSGKSTQSVKIMEKYDFNYLSTDFLIVEEISSGSHKGRELEELLKSDKSIPDKAIMCMYKKVIFIKSGASNGFVIDGFPTCRNESNKFQRYITPVDMIIYLDCDDDILIERVKNRPSSSSIKVNDEALRQSIEQFRKNIFEILTSNEKKTLRIKAEGSEEEVFECVVAGIDCLLKKRAEQEPEICQDKGPTFEYRKSKSNASNISDDQNCC